MSEAPKRTACGWCGCPPEGTGDEYDLARDPSLWVELIRADGSTFWICPWCEIDSNDAAQAEALVDEEDRAKDA